MDLFIEFSTYPTSHDRENVLSRVNVLTDVLKASSSKLISSYSNGSVFLISLADIKHKCLLTD